jgi:hypothetical protein
MALALAARRDIQDARLRELVDRALNNQKRVRNIIDGLSSSRELARDRLPARARTSAR